MHMLGRSDRTGPAPCSVLPIMDRTGRIYVGTDQDLHTVFIFTNNPNKLLCLWFNLTFEALGAATSVEHVDTEQSAGMTVRVCIISTSVTFCDCWDWNTCTERRWWRKKMSSSPEVFTPPLQGWGLHLLRSTVGEWPTCDSTSKHWLEPKWLIC